MVQLRKGNTFRIFQVIRKEIPVMNLRHFWVLVLSSLNIYLSMTELNTL